MGAQARSWSSARSRLMTGKQAFQGEDVTEILAAVIRSIGPHNRISRLTAVM
jgi:hypothetical protein